MLSKNDVIQREPLKMVALDQLVPQDHLRPPNGKNSGFSFIEIYTKRKEAIERFFRKYKRKAWHALGPPIEGIKMNHAEDACVRCLESKNKLGEDRKCPRKRPNAIFIHKKSALSSVQHAKEVRNVTIPYLFCLQTGLQETIFTPRPDSFFKRLACRL